MQSRSSSWFLTQRVERPRARVFCFPSAGGSPATYLRWQPSLPQGVEVCAVQLPGRGSRMAEPLCHDMAELLPALAEEIRPLLDLPAVFLGHSLGAIVAFEMTRRCSDAANLKHLVASGCRAPEQWPSDRGKYIVSLSGDAFIEAVQGYGGFPDEVFENEELMELLLPVIRADFNLVGSYRYEPAPALTVPVSILAGTGDPHVPVDGLHAWQKECVHPIETHLFDGGHLFITERQEAVLPVLSRIVEAVGR